jgi:hypothetical protein
VFKPVWANTRVRIGEDEYLGIFRSVVVRVEHIVYFLAAAGCVSGDENPDIGCKGPLPVSIFYFAEFFIGRIGYVFDNEAEVVAGVLEFEERRDVFFKGVVYAFAWYGKQNDRPRAFAGFLRAFYGEIKITKCLHHKQQLREYQENGYMVVYLPEHFSNLKGFFKNIDLSSSDRSSDDDSRCEFFYSV